MKQNFKDTGEIYSAGLCCSCGLCASYCPTHAIKFQYDVQGFLRPVIDSDQCLNCGMCVKFCPGGIYNKDNLKCNVDGTIYWGCSTNKKLQKNAASGGMVTELFVYLLKNNIVDYCIVVPNVRDVSNVKAVVTNSIKTVYACKTSKYCPVDYTEAVNQIEPDKYRYAIVGLPCQIASLCKYYVKWRNRFIFVSLLCNHMPSANATMSLYSNFGADKKSGIIYRGGGWPGYMTIWRKKTYIKLPFRKAWNQTGFGTRFYNGRCRICNDSIGESADLSVGDAYFLTEREMGEGQTVCIVRSHKLELIIEEMCKKQQINVYVLSEKYKLMKTLALFEKRNQAIGKELAIRKRLGLSFPINSELLMQDDNINVKLKDIFIWIKREGMNRVVSGRFPLHKLIWKIMFVKAGAKKIDGMKKGKKR